MSGFGAWLVAAGCLLAFGLAGWLVSLAKRDVSIVDSMWSLMFLAAALVFSLSPDAGLRTPLVLLLVTLWSLRLSAYITWRNWGEGEDYRYQRIRAGNSPGFEWKSLYIVFGLQAALAAVISVPLLAAIESTRPMGLFDVAGVLLWIVGFVFETVADLQLALFKRRPGNAGKVLDSGLWQFTRHPNYFGDFCVWWGFFLIALSGGGWWTAFAPLLMSFLLLRVSGVALLERDIGLRRPAYADYRATTNAFFPGPKKQRRASQ